MSIPFMTPGLATPQLGQATVDLRQRVEAVSQEAVTGRRSDVTAHLNGNIGDALLSQKALSDLRDERAQIAIRTTRLDIVQNALGAVRDTVSGIDAQLLAATGRGDDAAVRSVSDVARSALDDVLDTLNARQGERYLFSGTATASRPFAGSDQLLADVAQLADDAADAGDFSARLAAYFDTPGAAFQANVYQGNANPPDSDTITALDPGLKDLISGLAVAAIADPGHVNPLLNTDSSVLSAAAAALSKGSAALISSQAELGSAQASLVDRQDRLSTEETVLTQALNALTGRDQYEAATELKSLENNLEAAYLLTSRLANLSLINFIR